MDYISYAIKNLEEMCLDCKDYDTENCIKRKCNIGFALTTIKSVQKDGKTIIKDGIRLIPKEDMKIYDKSTVARCTAAICKTCKQCRQGHSENCTISLARRSMESIVLKDVVYYPGNMLGYIIKVAEQDRDFAGLIKKEIQALD